MEDEENGTFEWLHYEINLQEVYCVPGCESNRLQRHDFLKTHTESGGRV